jgi:hypothetical protein
MAISNHQPTLNNRFDYYDQQGNHLAQSHGATPETAWFEQAHYVVNNQTQLLKNQDSRASIQKDIDCFRQELIATPISNISSIVEINNVIRALCNYLEATKTPHVSP